MTAYETQTLANAIAECLYQRLTSDEKFIKKVGHAMQKKKRMLTTREVSNLLGISQWTVRKIAKYLGATKPNAKGDKNGEKHYGHLLFQEDGIMERYEKYLRTRE